MPVPIGPSTLSNKQIASADQNPRSGEKSRPRLESANDVRPSKSSTKQKDLAPRKLVTKQNPSIHPKPRDEAPSKETSDQQASLIERPPALPPRTTLQNSPRGSPQSATTVISDSYMVEIFPQVSDPTYLRHLRAVSVDIEPEEFDWRFTSEAREMAKIFAKYILIKHIGRRGQDGRRKESERSVAIGDRVLRKS